MKKKKVLRLCHKFLVNNDGYDLDVRDLCISTSSKYKNYVLTYINFPLNEFVKRNKLVKKDFFYHHPETGSYVLPVELDAKSINYEENFYTIKNIRKLTKNFREVYEHLRPEIIHIHGTLLLQFLYAALYFRKKSKIFATNHLGHINKLDNNPKINIYLLKYLVHNIFPFFCDNVFCVSNYSKSSFKFYSKNTLIINPVPRLPISEGNECIKKILSKNILESGFRIKNNDKVLCCIGRISIQKNQLNVVRAFNEIIKKNKNYKLILIGKIKYNEYYTSIKKEIEKNPSNYCLLDETENSKIIKIIEESHCLIAPSFNEGLGRNAMEAMLLGKPVIASKRTGYDDFIIHGKNGLLVDPSSIEEIKNGIEDIENIKNIKGTSLTFDSTHECYIKRILEVYGSG